MNHLIVQTAIGPIYLVGQLYTDTSRPALVAVGGAWAPDEFNHELVDWFPGASVLIAPLPGMGGSTTITFEPARLSVAMDEVIGLLLPGRSIVAYGASTGALVTLGLRSPGILRHVAVEPFFRTAPLWPLLKSVREFIAKAPEMSGGARAAEEIFGLAGDKVVDRDYRPLLEGLCVPTDVVLAQMPLEPEREMGGWPSLTSAEDRRRLADHPLVTLHNGPPDSRHDIAVTPEGSAIVKKVLLQALRAARDEAASPSRLPQAVGRP